MKNAGGDPLFSRPSVPRCRDCGGAGSLEVQVNPPSGNGWRATVPCRCRRPVAGPLTATVLRDSLPQVKWHPPVAVFEGERQRHEPTDLELPGGQRVQVVWEADRWTLWVLTPAPQLAAAYAAFLLFHAVAQALGREFAVLGVTTDQARGSWAAHELEEAVRNALRAGVAHDAVRDVVWDALTGG